MLESEREDNSIEGYSISGLKKDLNNPEKVFFEIEVKLTIAEKSYIITLESSIDQNTGEVDCKSSYCEE